MKLCFYLNSLSPHQVPLFNELSARVGFCECAYIAISHIGDERQKCGWDESRITNGNVLFGARHDSDVINSIVLEC